MSTDENRFLSYVYSLSPEEFAGLQSAVHACVVQEKFNASNFEKLAYKYERLVICPYCGCTDHTLSGHTPGGRQRWKLRQTGEDIKIKDRSRRPVYSFYITNCLIATTVHAAYLDNGADTGLTVGIKIVSYCSDEVNNMD